jgi:hypothetical protein
MGSSWVRKWHVRMVWFGTGEARRRSFVSKDLWEKPMVNSTGVQWESDGVVVPVITAQHVRGYVRGLAGGQEKSSRW